jgi:hypothetical protein
MDVVMLGRQFSQVWWLKTPVKSGQRRDGRVAEGGGLLIQFGTFLNAAMRRKPRFYWGFLF